MQHVPDEVKRTIEGLCEGAEVDVAVESDLGPDGLIGRQWLVATRQRLCIVQPDHGDPIVTRDVAVKDLVDINAEGLVGSGCVPELRERRPRDAQAARLPQTSARTKGLSLCDWSGEWGQGSDGRDCLRVRGFLR